MTDTVLLPVYRGVLHAHIERGIHWSEIEHLLLWCLTQGTFGTRDLVARCGLPEGVVVESIVRLMRVGWVELVEQANRVAFEASAAGRVEADKDTLTPIARTVSRNLHFVIDKMEGCVLSLEGLNLVKARDVPNSDKPAPRMLAGRLGDEDLPGYVELIDKLSAHAKMLYPDEKIVGVDTDRSSCDPDWFARLTISGDRVEGLPEAGTAELRRLIANEAGQLASPEPTGGGSNNRPASTAVRPTSPERSINLSLDDIIVGGPAHEACLRQVLADARRRVIVHSTFISSAQIERQMQCLKSAADQGARIDLLWDRSEDDEGAKILGECRALIKANGLASSVRIGDFPTKSHAKFLLADDGAGGYQIVVGSCNWFRSRFTSMEMSVRLRCPLVVSDFLQLVEKMIPAGVRQSALREEVVALALDLRQQPAVEGGSARMRFVPKGGHEDLIHEVQETAEAYVLVGSNKAGNAAETQVLAPLNEAAMARPVKVEIYYQNRRRQSALSAEVLEQLKNRYSRIKIMPIGQAHAKLLCWDCDNVVVTSLNWLSKDASPSNPSGEIGVLIRSKGLADVVKQAYLGRSDFTLAKTAND